MNASPRARPAPKPKAPRAPMAHQPYREPAPAEALEPHASGRPRRNVSKPQQLVYSNTAITAACAQQHSNHSNYGRLVLSSASCCITPVELPLLGCCKGFHRTILVCQCLAAPHTVAATALWCSCWHARRHVCYKRFLWCSTALAVRQQHPSLLLVVQDVF